MRLTSAELAADYWMLWSRRQRMLGYGDGPGSETQKQADQDLERMETIIRFSILPHYDEGQKMSAHQHEEWQMLESAKGGRYCGACGEHEEERGAK